jgi:phosphatidylglycerol:prolipoprotein diacylglycerol transferase
MQAYALLDPAKTLPHGPRPNVIATGRPLLSEYFALPLAALPFPDIDPVIVHIGPLAVHWYGVGYIVGILFAWWYAKRLVMNPKLWPDGILPMKPVDLDDFIVWAAIGVVLGGRTGYVLFYDLQRYIAHPLDIFAVWQGGMSFHGGLLGVILAMTLFSYARGIRTWTLFDVVAAGVPVGLGLVRIANFVNAELWGRVTDVPWGVVFCNDRILQAGQCLAGTDPRHPSQIYEALLEGVVLFLVLRLLTHSRLRLKTPRFVSGAFLAGYGASRIFVEFFREPDQQLGYLLGTGWLTMGMVLSLPMLLAGIWAMATAAAAAQKSESILGKHDG